MTFESSFDSKSRSFTVLQIIQHYNDIESWFAHYQGAPPYPVADNYNLGSGVGRAGQEASANMV